MPAKKLCLIWSIILALLPLSSNGQNFGRTNDTKKVTISVLMDRDLWKEAEAEKEIRDSIKFVSEIFEKESAITFEIKEFIPWPLPVGKEEVDIKKALESVALEANSSSSDITIGFTKKRLALESCQKQDGQKICSKSEKAGYAYVLGNAAVVLLDQNAKFIAAHEIGHLFGAEHTNEMSIMNEIPLSVSKFDEKNKQIIVKNRERAFDKFFMP